MSRNYVCGVIRDRFDRYLVVKHGTSDTDSVASISAESWVGKTETPIKALTSEVRLSLGIPSLDILNLRTTKIINRVGIGGNMAIAILLFEVKCPVTFKFADDVLSAQFLQERALLEEIKTERIKPTVFSRNVVSSMHIWNTVV